MTTIQTPHGEIIAIQTVGGYDLQIDGKTVAYAEKRAGIWRVYGRSFLTIQRAAAYVAKTYEPAPEPAEIEAQQDDELAAEQVQNEYEIGSHLADEQAQNEHDTYCAMQYEQELEREQATRQMYEQAPTYTPKKIILGLPDGTAKIVLITGENELIPARKICRVCGGEAKDSTALVHDSIKTGTHNIYQQDKLATRRAVCLKCKECGHSWKEGKQAEN